MDRSIILAALSAVSLWLVHNQAHEYYGASPEAVGSVGVVVALASGLGVYINQEVVDGGM
jgi:hypothetical protein